MEPCPFFCKDLYIGPRVGKYWVCIKNKEDIP